MTLTRLWLRLVSSNNFLKFIFIKLNQFVSARVYEMRAQMNAGKIGESEKVPMLQRLLKHQYSTTQPMPDHDIISECMGHL